MTDRELLELAAKAAGIALRPMAIKPAPPAEGDGFIGYMTDPDQWPRGWFQPLTDDGDALRLAHKINASIQCCDGCKGPGHFGFFSWVEVRIGGRPQCVKEFHAQNPSAEAATRRAIVRAAAEIGRNM